MASQHILVAFGGVSPEHEVSVLTAMQAISGLHERSYTVLPLYIAKSGKWLTGPGLLELENYQDLDQLEQQSTPCTLTHDEMGSPILMELQKKSLFQSRKSYALDTAVVAFHGGDGENGGFQGLCETLNLPYTGSGVLASSLGMDKVRAKSMCHSQNIPVVDSFSLTESDWEGSVEQHLERATQLGFPLIVKPVHLGSSIGVIKAEEESELQEAIETSFRYDTQLMVEKVVQPLMEINCALIGDEYEAEPSVCERPLGSGEMLSYEDKYQRGDSGGKGMASADRQVPADIPETLSNHIQELSVNIFKLFRASGIARIDFLVNSETQEVYFNEINTIPGSFSFYLWEESGYNMAELMERLLKLGKDKHRRKNSRIRSYDTNLLSEKAVKGLKGLKTNK